jgi:hypothetical protein
MTGSPTALGLKFLTFPAPITGSLSTCQLQVRHQRVLKLDAGHLVVDAVEQIVLVAAHLVKT